MKLAKLEIFVDPENPPQESLSCHCHFDNGVIHAIRDPIPADPKEFRMYLQYVTDHMSDWYEQRNGDFK